MPTNKHAQLRYQAIDKCLRRRSQRYWRWPELARACAEHMAIYENSETNVPSRRTILQDIADMRSGKLGYEAPIAADREQGYYYTDPHFSIRGTRLSDEDADKLRQAVDWLAQFSHWQVVQGAERTITQLHEVLRTRDRAVRPVVQFDQLTDAPGLQWLNPLYTATTERRCVWLDYRPFDYPPVKTVVSPYLLKEYNKRWFLIGYDAQARRIHTFALDRIHALESAAAQRFLMEESFDPATWYEHLIGVSKPYDGQPEHILIWASPLRSKYLASKPLHPSQTRLTQTRDGSQFSFYLIVNFEFRRLLLSFGDDIEVLQPAALRRDIAARHLAGAQRYFPDGEDIGAGKE